MGRAKTVKTEQTEAQLQNPEEQKPSVTQDNEANEANEKVEISPAVDKTLKAFPQYEKLYVGPFGQVFTEDTPAEVRGKCKLYDNPYFNN